VRKSAYIARKYDMNKKESKAKKPSIKGEIIGLLTCIPFFLFGLAMIGVSVNEISYTLNCTAETKGTVNDVSSQSQWKISSKGKRHRVTTYTAHYSYEIDGKEFTDTLTTASWLKKGKTLKIRYKPGEPNYNYVKGYDDAGNFLPLIFGTIWDGFLLVLIAFIILSIIRKKFKKNNVQKELIGSDSERNKS
jgi:hypothetical protein